MGKICNTNHKTATITVKYLLYLNLIQNGKTMFLIKSKVSLALQNYYRRKKNIYTEDLLIYIYIRISMNLEKIANIHFFLSLFKQMVKNTENKLITVIKFAKIICDF